MTLGSRDLIGYAWLALLTVWFIGALRVKRGVRVQPTGPRILHSTLLLIASGLVFSPLFNFGFLRQRFVPDSPNIAALGLALTLVGIGFASWARFFLGTNWSAAPSVKQGHTLIRGGPYAIVRHPIYSGLLLALFGTALAKGQWKGLLGVTIVGLAWHFKSRVEERFMEEEFGTQYILYRREVKGLIPFVL